MKCKFCKTGDTRVIDSRESPDATEIRRRRECLSCGRRFTTYESILAEGHVSERQRERRQDVEREKRYQERLAEARRKQERFLRRERR